jgi:transposase
VRVVGRHEARASRIVPRNRGSCVSRSSLATMSTARWRRAAASARGSCGRVLRRPLSASSYSAAKLPLPRPMEGQPGAYGVALSGEAEARGSLLVGGDAVLGDESGRLRGGARSHAGEGTSACVTVLGGTSYERDTSGGIVPARAPWVVTAPRRSHRSCGGRWDGALIQRQGSAMHPEAQRSAGVRPRTVWCNTDWLGHHRWKVERTFTWLARYRRLTIRYEPVRAAGCEARSFPASRLYKRLLELRAQVVKPPVTAGLTPPRTDLSRVVGLLPHSSCLHPRTSSCNSHASIPPWADARQFPSCSDLRSPECPSAFRLRPAEGVPRGLRMPNRSHTRLPGPAPAAPCRFRRSGPVRAACIVLAARCVWWHSVPLRRLGTVARAHWDGPRPGSRRTAERPYGVRRRALHARHLLGSLT